MKSNNDLSILVDKYLNQKKNKKIFYDKDNQLNLFDAKILINIIKNNLFVLSKKRKKNLIIGILVERNVHYLLSIFACWKSGSTIIPLNKSWPKQYLKEIREKIKFDYILTDVENYNKEKIFLQLKKIIKSNKYQASEIDLIKHRKKNTTPYIIFTSGSSGIQKGVQISSDGYLDYISWTKNNFKKYKSLSPLIITAEMTFDITMGDIAYALANNTSIVISSSAKNFFEHLHLIKKYKVEIFYSVPSTINLILNYSEIKNEIKTIKLFMSGGDVFNINMVQKIIKNNPKSVFYNVYGPTECTINVTSLRMDNLYKQNKLKNISIGKVFKHLNYKLVNDVNGKFIENKKTGELIISGNQVMKDYVNNENTEKDYFIYINNKKYYRTGDLVTKKKNLLYLKGRVDDLVKIRGYRINPLEVDNMLFNTKKIINSKTLVDNKKNILITFVQLNKTSSINQVNKLISKKLPGYMIPSKIITLKKFPLGKSGKIDKKKLMKLYVG